jgi:hypothetical protein
MEVARDGLEYSFYFVRGERLEGRTICGVVHTDANCLPEQVTLHVSSEQHVAGSGASYSSIRSNRHLTTEIYVPKKYADMFNNGIPSDINPQETTFPQKVDISFSHKQRRGRVTLERI